MLTPVISWVHIFGLIHVLPSRLEMWLPRSCNHDTNCLWNKSWRGISYVSQVCLDSNLFEQSTKDLSPSSPSLCISVSSKYCLSYHLGGSLGLPAPVPFCSFAEDYTLLQLPAQERSECLKTSLNGRKLSRLDSCINKYTCTAEKDSVDLGTVTIASIYLFTLLLSFLGAFCPGVVVRLSEDSGEMSLTRWWVWVDEDVHRGVPVVEENHRRQRRRWSE